MKDAPARKHLGQNFLHDPQIIDKIVESIGPSAGDKLVEIGPGRGAITGPLLDAGVCLTALELDQELAAALPGRFPGADLTVHPVDALKFDFAVLGSGDLRLVGNLPYNVSTPLLFHVLASAAKFRDLHVMLQKEVVLRMAADPGSRAYGRLSVAVGARCRITPLFRIGPGAFKPAPKVDSMFVRLTPDAQVRSQISSEPLFDRVVTQAFSQRRKQLANGLKTLISAAELRELNIDPACRAETLQVADFIGIANALARRESALKR